MNNTFRLATAFMLCSLIAPANAGIQEDVQRLLAEGNFQAAIQQAEIGLQQNNGNRALLLAKGFALVQLNRLDEAARYYEQLRRVMPDDPEPGNNLAMIYRMQKKYPQSITVFAETIRAFPNYSHAYGNLGDTYIELAQDQYQQGFDMTGNPTLQQKATLSGDFDRLVTQATLAKPSQPVVRARAVPAPAPATLPAEVPDPALVEQSIVEKLSTWTDDWMSRDSNRYFAHYSQQFIPAGDKSLDDWMQHKRNTLAKAEFIKVWLTDINIVPSGENPDTASVEFHQAYASSTFKGSSRKKLDLKNSSNGWLIVAETNVNN